MKLKQRRKNQYAGIRSEGDPEHWCWSPFQISSSSFIIIRRSIYEHDVCIATTTNEFQRNENSYRQKLNGGPTSELIAILPSLSPFPLEYSAFWSAIAGVDQLVGH